MNVTKAQLKTSSINNGIFIRLFFYSHCSIKCIIVHLYCMSVFINIIQSKNKYLNSETFIWINHQIIYIINKQFILTTKLNGWVYVFELILKI